MSRSTASCLSRKGTSRSSRLCSAAASLLKQRRKLEAKGPSEERGKDKVDYYPQTAQSRDGFRGPIREGLWTGAQGYRRFSAVMQGHALVTLRQLKSCHSTHP